MTEHKQGEMAVLALQTVQKVLPSLLSQLIAKNEKLFADSGHPRHPLLGCMIKAYSAVGIHQLGCWLANQEQLQFSKIPKD